MPRQLLHLKSIKEIDAIELKNPILREIATDENVKLV
jgi:hypothetical protein